ncbi:flagellar biosynthetic protein FliR [Magnetovibrio sp.]|uniref:flagellar biosynthetic protein FliR n=1 Tax=Magnetovibrio sp. TaxID=2024836 RepID=UPI002F933C2B
MLSELINLNLFAFLLIFARIGTAFSLMPGFGSQQVPMTARLVFALLVSLLVTPILLPIIPTEPAAPSVLVLLLISEVLIGAFLGTIPRIFLGSLQTAGTILAMVSSMANSFIQDPISEQQSAVLSTFISTVAITLVFVTDTHHLMLMAVVDSYNLFVPAEGVQVGDMTDYIAHRVADSFRIGVQISSPLVVSGVAYYLVLGIMGRLMPQLPVFFFGMPIQIAMQIWILILSLSGMMIVFMRYFEGNLYNFLIPLG